MANGFMPGLLLTQKQVFQGATPSTKITPVGFLEMLLASSTPNIISSTIDDGSGHVRDVKVKYKPRSAGGTSVTVDDCSFQSTPMYAEQTIPSLSFRAQSIMLEDSLIAKYEKEASTSVSIGKPVVPGGILQEFWDTLIRMANGLMLDIDKDLLTAQAAAFGKNQQTGSNAARTINFPLSTTTNPLSQGVTSLVSDVMQNEIKPTEYFVVGDGLINNVYVQMRMGTQNTTQQNYPAGVPPFFWDPNCTSSLGANQFGVFEKNAVQLININKFDGFVGGDKLSTFLFTLTLPLANSLGGTELSGFKFDAQLQYVPCPTNVQFDGAVDGSSNPILTAVKRGWKLTLMANYGLLNLPTDAYLTNDRLTGNNGTLRYLATNT